MIHRRHVRWGLEHASARVGGQPLKPINFWTLPTFRSIKIGFVRPSSPDLLHMPRHKYHSSFYYTPSLNIYETKKAGGPGGVNTLFFKIQIEITRVTYWYLRRQPVSSSHCLELLGRCGLHKTFKLGNKRVEYWNIQHATASYLELSSAHKVPRDASRLQNGKINQTQQGTSRNSFKLIGGGTQKVKL